MLRLQVFELRLSGSSLALLRGKLGPRGLGLAFLDGELVLEDLDFVDV